MALTRDEIRRIAQETLGQYKNPTWYNNRIGKLLTTNFQDAVKMCDKIDNLPKMKYREAWKLVNNEIPQRRSWLTHTDVKSFYPWLKWGVTHERDGLREYERSTKNFVRRSGLWMYPSGNIGGSPDGLVYDYRDAAEPSGILEVKCPWKLRNNKTISDETLKSNLDYLDEELKLVKAHQYYTTIQGNMEAVQVKWCDFVVWTPARTIISRVEYDEEWIQRNIPRIENYYTKGLAPKMD